MEQKVVVTVNDYERLMSLILEKRPVTKGSSEVVNLDRKLTMAIKVAPEKIARGLVTMNSSVLLRDVTSGRESEVTITYPDTADNRSRRVSILSTVGLLLLGRREHEVVSWGVPSGIGNFLIVKVTYQPEAAGDYNS